MSRSRIVVAAVVAVGSIGAALACGPNFPWQLLGNRAATLAQTPVGLEFESLLRNVVGPPQGQLTVVESSEGADERPVEAVKVEQGEARSDAWRGLVAEPSGQRDYQAILANARAAASAEEVFTAGAGLPAAVLEYIAGAIAFKAEKFEEALKRFQAIDSLPPDQRRLREVAAAFMQGRTQRQLGNFVAARAAFRAARARALAGAPDPIGLGVASLGEEARLDLIEAELVEAPAPLSPDRDRTRDAELIARAVELYAEQAARGSEIGRLSLRDVASMLIANEELLAKAVSQAIVRRLVVAYCIAHDSEYAWYDPGYSSPDTISEPVIKAVLAQREPTDGDDIDRLAMLAYQTGRYDAAERLTVRTDRALGLWVRAKLAFRRGDRAAAIRDWGAALQTATPDLDEPARTRLQGEFAVAHLVEGRYREFLDLLFPLAQTYWGDVVYVAERILTVDELKAFVDTVPATDTPFRDSWIVPNPIESLRGLLARRLMREGRVDEALAYFPKANRDGRNMQTMAADYRELLGAAQPTWRWRSVSRAEALFKLAMMTRRQGLELLGTEGPPDMAALDGGFAGGIGQSSPYGQQNPDTPAAGALLAPDEKRRFAASAPKPDLRFHYRSTAADRAMAAAELLPQRSQAYAATLCWAARFAIDSDDQPRATSIYRLYVATGPYQAWANKFGRACPDPDFDAARDYWPKRLLKLAKRHAELAVLAAVGVVLLLAGSVVAIRRRRAA